MGADGLEKIVKDNTVIIIYILKCSPDLKKTEMKVVKGKVI